METTQHFFGDDVDTTVFDLDRTDASGQPVCCTLNTGNKWFQFKTVEPSILSFCEYCGKNYFEKGEVSEIDFSKYPHLKGKLECDTRYTKRCKSYGIQRRCIETDGVQVNVNIVNHKNDSWRPTMRIPTSKGNTAFENGVGIFPLSSMSYWEFVIQGIPGGVLNNPDYFLKMKSARFGDGRTVSYTDESGNSNIYFNAQKSQMIVNSYRTGTEGERFLFVAPSKLEREHHLEAPHNNESNKVFITVGVYKKEQPPQPKTVWRGGGATRGCNYTGGSNFAASGYSELVKTESMRDELIEINSIDFTIQLVNNEEESSLLHYSQTIQEKVDNQIEMDIEKLIKERDAIDERIRELMNETSRRSKILSHKDQTSYLL